MIAAPVAGIVDPGPPKQVRVTHSADGCEYAYIHSKSGAATPHSEGERLIEPINYGDVLGAAVLLPLSMRPKHLMRNHGIPK